VLMGLFANLDGDAREAALDALGRSVAKHGADSVRAYRDAVGVEALPSMMEGAAASLGWGRWRFEAGDPVAAGDVAAAGVRSLHLTVADSPFAAEAPRGVAACHAIAGMLEALGTAMFASPARARETHCAAQGGEAACRFVVAPRDPAPTSPRPPSEPTPARRHQRQGDLS